MFYVFYAAQIRFNHNKSGIDIIGTYIGDSDYAFYRKLISAINGNLFFEE